MLAVVPVHHSTQSALRVQVAESITIKTWQVVLIRTTSFFAEKAGRVFTADEHWALVWEHTKPSFAVAEVVGLLVRLEGRLGLLFAAHWRVALDSLVFVIFVCLVLADATTCCC